jgi:hypothetical protein
VRDVWTVLAALALAACQAAAHEVARDFCRATGMTAAQAASHMEGIDFRCRVRVATLPAGTEVEQFEPPGPPLGHYPAPLGTAENRLGIDSAGRKRRL